MTRAEAEEERRAEARKKDEEYAAWVATLPVDMRLRSCGGADTANALLAFGECLRIVHKEFGDENMTQEVMQAAISAASYMAWRSIMGESKPMIPPGVRKI